MATFRGLSLDPITHDLHLDASNNLAVVEDNAAIAQHVKQRLHFYRGEWFLDTLAGTPWFQDVFVRPHNQVVIESVIKREILDTPGIAGLTAFDLRIDERKRHIEVVEAVARSTLDADLVLNLPSSPVPEQPETITVPVSPPEEPEVPGPQVRAALSTVQGVAVVSGKGASNRAAAGSAACIATVSGAGDSTVSVESVERLLSDSMTPGEASAAGAGAGIVLGVNLYFTVPGEVRTVHFWRDARTSSSIAIGAWDSAGTLIASRALTKAPPAVDGWDSVDFTAPVAVVANTKYTIAWWQDDVAGSCYFARTEEAFRESQFVSPNGVIIAPIDGSTVNGQSYINGAHEVSDTLTFPTATFNQRNYLVDVTFAYEASGSTTLLNPLFFSGGGTIPEGRPVGTWVGDLNGETDGSTVTLIDDGGGRFSLDQLQIYTTSTPIDYETLPAGKTIPITVRETHPNASGPRDTVLNITITDADEGDADAAAFLGRIAAAGVTTTPEYQTAVDLFFRRIKRVPDLYGKIQRLGNTMLAPNDAVSLWDWKSATNNATVSAAYTRSNRGITWTGAGTQLVIPATANAQDSQFVGFHIHQYTWASGLGIIGSSSGQIQVLAPTTSNTGNLSARLNAGSTRTGTGAKHASLWGLVFLDRGSSTNFTLGINAGEQNEFVEALTQTSVAPTWTNITFDAENSVVSGWAIGEHLTEAERAHLRYCFEAFKYELDAPAGSGVAEEGTFVADANPNSRIGSPGILRPTIIGYKPSANMVPTGPTGHVANSNNLRFAGFSSRNMGNGTVFVSGTIDGLVVEDIDFINGYRGVEVKNANCTNFRFRRLNMYGAERSLIRISDTSGTFNSIGGSAGNPALIEDCYVDTGGSYFVGDPFQVGIDIASGHYITVRRCTAKGAMSLGSGFRNGDGFLAEGGVTDLRYEQCLAESNVDGGYDTKPSNTVFVDCESRFNGRNFKFWGQNIQYTGTTITRSPLACHFSPNSSGTNASCTIENLVIDSTNIDVPIFEFDVDMGNGAATINILNYTFVGGMMADQALIFYRNSNSFTVNWGPQGRPPGGRDLFV